MDGELKDVLEEKLPLAGPLALLFTALIWFFRPRAVYDRFIWKYFWGPVVADARGVASVTYHGVEAHPGYTLVSEAVYGLVLVYFLLLTVRLLDRIGSGRERNWVLYFVPFVVSGGLLRVVEDASVLSTPWSYLVISPVIYITLASIAVSSLLAGHLLEEHGLIGSQNSFVAVTGTVFSAVLAVLLAFSGTVENAWMLPATLALSGAVFVPFYAFLKHLSSNHPGLESVLGLEGGTVLFSHLIDSSATSLSIDVLGYGEKHPVVEFVMGASGTPYAFLPAKILVISAVLYYLDDDLRAESPLIYNLTLLGVLALGLGPGVRNMTRAVLGV
ncbi:MAG: DUF63 family protein [Candidatus Nanohaloarchaea archaeon]|nr:DUF63 family protein [Candidatus Nanohaloarchaea archaeon]